MTPPAVYMNPQQIALNDRNIMCSSNTFIKPQKQPQMICAYIPINVGNKPCEKMTNQIFVMQSTQRESEPTQ